MNPACEQSQICPTLGAQGRGQRRATLRRNGKRAPPVVAHRHTIQPSHAEPSSHFAEAQIHARLTNPAKPNIITSIRGSRRPVADFKSEPRPASNRNQWPASYWNAWPASSVSATLPLDEIRRRHSRHHQAILPQNTRNRLRSSPNRRKLKIRTLETMVATRGPNFPLGRLEGRLRCPACGNRRVTVVFEPPSNTQVGNLST